MAATFGGGGGSVQAAPLTTCWVFDSNSSQGTGAVSTGLGLSGTDHASISASRLGGAPGTDLKYDDDGNPAA